MNISPGLGASRRDFSRHTGAPNGSATVILPLLLWSVLAAPAERPVAPPRLTVAPAGKVELGSLGPREARTLRYTLTNTSGAPIALRVLDQAPGLLVDGPALAAPIAAGAAAALRVRVDPTGWEGPQTRNVRLGTDDPDQGLYYLPTHMTVRPELAVDRQRGDFGAVAPHESPQQVFTFVRETGEPTELKVVPPLPPYLECELRTVAPGRWQLVFTLRPGQVEPGVLQGLERVAVATSAPLQPRFDLYLPWTLAPPIGPSPGRVVFVDPGQGRQTLELASRSGQPFQVLSAEVEGAGFRVELPQGPPAPRQSLTVRRTAEAAARAMLVLRFRNGDAPLKVPLVYSPSGLPKAPGA